MAEANYLQDGLMIDWTPTAALAAGQIIQLPDGRAAFAPTAIAAGVQGAVQVGGICQVTKTASMVMLKGSRVYWDHSANAAHLLQVNDRDFFLGTVQDTAASAATTVNVDLNCKVPYTVSIGDGAAHLPISTAGWPHIVGSAEGVSLIFDTAVEAQKLDALSLRGVAPATPCLVEALVCVNVNGDDAAFDFNVGLANGTHATDADSITESLFCHIDGNSTNINFESDDGTTEVAATDSTVDFAAGTPFLVQFDLEDNTDIQVYVNGVNVLPSSVFKLDAATGPLKLLAHMEKTSNDSPGNVTIQRLGLIASEER